MEVRITNGALLHKMWPDSVSAEMVAVCQYTNDAEDLAGLMIERDAKHQLGRPIYMITCIYSGKMTIVRAKSEPAA